jgi:hypothetical protein
VSRVALDVPPGHPYQVAVNGNALALLLPGVRAPASLAASTTRTCARWRSR